MNDYIQNVLKTESNDYEKIKLRLATRKIARLLHASIGMQTESGEFADELKRYIFYGKELDVTNLIEEIGDQLWYIAIALHELKSNFKEAEDLNIKKLFTRYGISFNKEGALNRDLSAERYILEKDKPSSKGSDTDFFKILSKKDNY